VPGAAQRKVAHEILDADAVFAVAIHRQPAEMVNEVVGVSALGPLAKRREEFVRTTVNRTAGDVEHDVRALPASMVDELPANSSVAFGSVSATVVGTSLSKSEQVFS